jgi:ligand-binding SRPBCC domain-containing protein
MMSISFYSKRGVFYLKTEQWIPVPVDKTFEFFSDARNLAEITPPWLEMSITIPEPHRVVKGTVIAYRIKVLGMPISWVAQIRDITPMRGFTDIQLKGPYKSWEHTHSFSSEHGGTRIRDTVKYEIPYGPLGMFLHNLLIRRQLEDIFSYREQKTIELLAGTEPTHTPEYRKLSPPSTYTSIAE